MCAVRYLHHLARRGGLAALLWLGLNQDVGAQGRGTEAFEKGVAAFELKNFAEAKDAFLSVVEKEQLFSADLGFYLGNTCYRMDDLGAAALWYRRGLLQEPSDPALRQNLRLLQRRTGFLEFTPTWGAKLASLMRHEGWIALVAGGLWVTAFALALMICTRWGARRRWLCGGMASVGGLLAAVAAWGAWGRLPAEEITKRAVVVKAETVAQAAPTGTAGVIIDLPPGSEVTVTEQRETWSCVTIPGVPDRGIPERTGWVRREALEPLWPYSAEVMP